MVDVIRLGGGMPQESNVLRLGTPKKTFKQKATRFLTTTAVIEAGILGTLLGGVFGGAKAAGFTALGLGILETSPKAASFLGRRISDPTGVGRGLGEIIEDPSQLLPKDKPVKEKVAEVVKKAGVVGGLAAAGVGAAVIAKKAIEKIRKPKVPQIPKAIIPVAAIPALQQLPSELLPETEPIGVVKKPVEEEKPALPTPSMPSINNKNTFSPEINIKFSKSRKFINQQVLVRS